MHSYKKLSVPPQKKQNLDTFHVCKVFSQYYSPDDPKVSQLVDVGALALPCFISENRKR